MRRHFVKKYSYSHERKRKALKKMLKHGMVKLVAKQPDGFLYEEVKGFAIDTSFDRVSVNGDVFNKFIKNHLAPKGE